MTPMTIAASLLSGLTGYAYIITGSSIVLLLGILLYIGVAVLYAGHIQAKASKRVDELMTELLTPVESSTLKTE